MILLLPEVKSQSAIEGDGDGDTPKNNDLGIVFGALPLPDADLTKKKRDAASSSSEIAVIVKHANNEVCCVCVTHSLCYFLYPLSPQIRQAAMADSGYCVNTGKPGRLIA